MIFEERSWTEALPSAENSTFDPKTGQSSIIVLFEAAPLDLRGLEARDFLWRVSLWAILPSQSQKKNINLDPWPSTGWIQGSAQIQSKNYGMVGNVLFWPLWPPHWLQGTIVDQHYYCDNILKGILFERIKKNATLGSKFAIKLVPNMSKMNFQQGGACPHTALRTQRMLIEKIPNYWDKGIWPANSPDPSPIEQLWSILGNKLEEMKPQPKNIASLERALTNAWKLITKETLQNLIQSMSSRIHAVIKAKWSNPLL